MPEFLQTVAGFFAAGVAGGVLGGFLVWVLASRTVQRSDMEPASVFGSVEEETAESPVIAPVLAQWFTAEPVVEPEPEPEPERAVAHRPMSAMERLEGPTVRIRIGRDERPVPWWMGDRHRVPESRLRTAPYVLAAWERIPTTEFPQLESWPTGEYEVLDGVS